MGGVDEELLVCWGWVREHTKKKVKRILSLESKNNRCALAGLASRFAWRVLLHHLQSLSHISQESVTREGEDRVSK